MIFEHVKAGRSPYFTLDLKKISETSQLVIAVSKRSYPTLAIPYHSRWRHFEVEGTDSYRSFRQLLPISGLERGRSLYDTVIISVLLDAGAGSAWQYRDLKTGQTFRSSEGLAIASLDLINSGFFSSQAKEPLRVDALKVKMQSASSFAAAMQHSEERPLLAIDGRWELLQNLARAMESQPEIFLRNGSVRLGHFFDHLVDRQVDQKISAQTILQEVLNVFGGIWPGRLTLEGRNLGDCWRHPAVVTGDNTSGLVPFHKLSQWLTYSLLEPLEDYGLRIEDLGSLTGLPEYRNGGLFIDMGVIQLKSEALATQVLGPNDEALIEWRALTVILLDLLAEEVRRSLGMTAVAMPLAKVLQGGTWTAGRQLAQERRRGAPPLAIKLEGTVF